MKFNIIYQQILKKIIQDSSFTYKFLYDNDNNTLSCKFDSIEPLDSKIVFINVKIDLNNDNKIFEINKQDQKVKKLSEKQFMMQFYKEYNRFKYIYKKYKQQGGQQEFDKSTQKDELNDEENLNDSVPKIETLDQILNKENINQNGIKIKNNNIQFNFKTTDIQNFQDIVRVQFNINLDNIDIHHKNKNEQYLINCAAYVKMYKNHDMILSVLLKNVDSQEEKQQNQDEFQDQNIIKNAQEITNSQFKERYPKYYKNLKEAVKIYIKRYFK